MGYLLKEGLKTLCGVNQWSYAVFWKIGCQNPKLLIWEECYYEPASRSDDFNGSWISAEASKVHLLVNKMMMDSHVNIVGEGLVGRVAFTGNHQWILSETYCGDSHPPEVVKEVCQQFSAGMQTVAVIPVLPHGVVQFGSCMTVMENLGFINDVTSLILQLGYVSGALISPNYEAPSFESNVAKAHSSFDSFNCAQSTSQYELQSKGGTFQAPNLNPRIVLPVINGVAKAEVISSNSESWRNQNTSTYMPKSLGLPSGLPSSTVRGLGQQILSAANSGSVYCSNDDSFAQPMTVEANGLCNGGKDELRDCKKEMGQTTFQENSIPLSQFSEHLNMVELIPSFVQDDDVCVQPELGDDLFDILGADFKNKFLSSCWNRSLSNELASNVQSWDSKNDMPHKKRVLASSESGIFSSAGSDHLLEAVVSNIQPCSKQSMDDNVSCRTTLTTNTSSSSRSNVSLPYGRFGVSDHLTNAGAMSSCFKEESRSYSQGSSIFGSQISSLMEKDHKAKPCNSVSASRAPDETGKPNRKRLKPGENPRPRPKDRQMFQDRVKELRELVPNGAKCSLDALLERTIKHMVFLQSVTKHADKLKQTSESKVISKDGGLLMKDKFEGGATWAYEVGSQSMVCPIIVEDLNQPRQMLVQMLCDERGLFLEIADIIRGLGLTILKGVMETRNNKIWARFAVEANRDVTRMEIFMSLVRLLEQSSNENAAAQQFQQVPMHSLQ